MKTAREIAARVWCDPEMSGVVMDTDAAEQIAIVIQSVRESQSAPQGIPNRRNFDDELVCLLNKYSKESGSNTPDFILADFIGRCLENWNLTAVAREEWHGRKFPPDHLEDAINPVVDPDVVDQVLSQDRIKQLEKALKESVDGRTADEMKIVAAIEAVGILREYGKGDGGIEPLPDFVARAVDLMRAAAVLDRVRKLLSDVADGQDEYASAAYPQHTDEDRKAYRHAAEVLRIVLQRITTP